MISPDGRLVGMSGLGPATEHDDRVAGFSELLARLAGFDEQGCRDIKLAARLHDIGKVTIPQEILDKPSGLDGFERALVQRHAEYGYHLLVSPGDDFLMLAATIAWTHHERWDGHGYPRGLRGTEIPIAGRIVAICDVFDALTRDRVYRHALPLAEGIEIMSAGRATMFDPELLDVFLGALPQFARLSDAAWPRLTSGAATDPRLRLVGATGR